MPDDEKTISVTSLEDTIRAWPTWFRDLNQGGDTAHWQQRAIQDYGPALLFGQATGATVDGVAVRLAGVISPDERARLSFPVFVDDDPLPASQAGTKTKFHGKMRWGLAVVTDQAFVMAHDFKSIDAVYRCPRSDVKALNELDFKFSFMSMTSAGPGFELLSVREGKPDRVVFRVALDPVNAVGFDAELHRLLLSGN